MGEPAFALDYNTLLRTNWVPMRTTLMLEAVPQGPSLFPPHPPLKGPITSSHWGPNSQLGNLGVGHSTCPCPLQESHPWLWLPHPPSFTWSHLGLLAYRRGHLPSPLPITLTSPSSHSLVNELPAPSGPLAAPGMCSSRSMWGPDAKPQGSTQLPP